MTENAAPGLLGDIGGTNARFALLQPDGTISRMRGFAAEDFPSLPAAIEAYLTTDGLTERPTQAALAVAAPVIGNCVTLTNHPWTFSIEGLGRELGLRRLHMVNDFVANALALPHLAPADHCAGRPWPAEADAPCAVLGPGTGLGMSALIPDGGIGVPLQSEGGHVTMAPSDARESAVLDRMRLRYDHVSAERVLSGPGIVNLYNVLCELSERPAAPFTAAQITDPRIEQEDDCAREATAMFCAMLGTVASDLALTLGARGGIYIAGGIVPRLGPRFVESGFRARFEAKGRFRDYLTGIPTYVITRPIPALTGLAKLLQQG